VTRSRRWPLWPGKIQRGGVASFGSSMTRCIRARRGLSYNIAHAMWTTAERPHQRRFATGPGVRLMSSP